MNIASAESAIVAAVTAVVPAGVRVMVSDEIASVEERSQFTPAVHVVYAGYSVDETAAQGKRAKVTHQWDVVAVTRSARDRGENTTARISTYDLADTVTRSLMGAVVTVNSRPVALALANGGGAFYGAGFAYISARFELETVVSKLVTP